MAKKMGLVLSGGGARGAYQVGILAAVKDIAQQSGLPPRFDYLSGVSAGAINASSLASNAHDFNASVDNLVKLWSNLTIDQVFSTNPLTMGRIGFQWMKDLSLGSLTGTTPGGSLLDTTPLRQMIHQNMDYAKVEQNIKDGHLTALAVTSVDYANSTTVTFVQGHESLPTWDKGRKRSEKAAISTEHIMASSAIPLLFPPIQVNDRFHGDGSVRNHAPCSPVIYLGAEKLLVIGVRKQSTTAHERRAVENQISPSVARVMNTILNGVLLDAIEQDIDRLKRLNEYAMAIPPEQHHKVALRPLDYLFISPSADIGEMAIHKAHKLPRIIRYLLKGLGSLEDASEIISYLLFEPSFCSDLIEIGYQDGLAHKEQIAQLLSK
ncbi:patatin-like phospholipase family protein [Bdellovibrio svalbardensis]|uniref:Patatin-like phospholipase family protein n=1 Tax=Bdellovibrio svalbardensis TaxID=2972972 RepID=A0ABT6DJK5_9BACT|nr:patatin-like phospholipase family protein [Bdellovibrio svalbardensis]MDG0816973.1 patatin-like phospholipase family protein [Bdellovibrio svalbardensis]